MNMWVDSCSFLGFVKPSIKDPHRPAKQYLLSLLKTRPGGLLNFLQVVVEVWKAIEKLPQVYKHGSQPVPVQRFVHGQLFVFINQEWGFFCLFVCFLLISCLSYCLLVHCLQLLDLYRRPQCLLCKGSLTCVSQMQLKKGHFGHWPCCCANSPNQIAPARKSLSKPKLADRESSDCRFQLCKLLHLLVSK